MSALLCPFDNCQLSFRTPADLENHIDSRHVEYSELVPVPDTMTSASTYTVNQSFETSSSHLPSPASPNISSFLSGFTLPANPMSTIDLTNDVLLHITGQQSIDDITVVVLKDVGLSELGGSQTFDLGQLRNLKELNLNQNFLLDAGPLGQLTTLEVLSLDHNQIMHVGPLSPLVNLRSLSICHNHLAYLHDFPVFPHLNDLKLSGNQLKDYSDVVSALKRQPVLTSLCIDGNPITRQQKHIRYKLLECLNLQSLDEEEVTPFDYVIAVDVTYRLPAKESLLASFLADILSDPSLKASISKLKHRFSEDLDQVLFHLASQVLSRHNYPS